MARILSASRASSERIFPRTDRRLMEQRPPSSCREMVLQRKTAGFTPLAEYLMIMPMMIDIAIIGESLIDNEKDDDAPGSSSDDDEPTPKICKQAMSSGGKKQRRKPLKWNDDVCSVRRCYGRDEQLECLPGSAETRGRARWCALIDTCLLAATRGRARWCCARGMWRRCCLGFGGA